MWDVGAGSNIGVMTYRLTTHTAQSTGQHLAVSRHAAGILGISIRCMTISPRFRFAEPVGGCRSNRMINKGDSDLCCLLSILRKAIILEERGLLYRRSLQQFGSPYEPQIEQFTAPPISYPNTTSP